MDQGEGNRVQLVTYEGKVLRDFATGADRASGITFDGEAIWLASTYNRQIIKANARTGETIERYYTPGAGRAACSIPASGRLHHMTLPPV